MRVNVDYFSKRNGIIEFFFFVILFLSMALGIFDAGPDPLIDTGREYYVPLAINHGKILYRDILYFNGPLTPFLNSIFFSVIPFSIQNAKLVNLAWIMMITFAIWGLGFRVAGRVCAFLWTFTFLTLVAFNNYSYTGKVISYLTPYSHEMIHGFFFSLLALILLRNYLDSSKNYLLFGIGFLIGLNFLMKPEFFISLVLAVGVVLVFTPSRIPHRLWRLALGFIVPIIPFVIYYGQYVSLSETLLSISGAWRYIFTTNVTDNYFYNWVRGTDKTAFNLGVIGLGLLGYAMVAGLLSFFRRSFERLPKIQLFFIVLVCYVLYLYHGEIFKPLPSVMGGYFVYLIWKRRNLSQYTIDEQFLLSFAVFSFFLLQKVILKVSVYGVGYVLAIPAILWLIFQLTKIPNQTIKTVVIGILIGTCFEHAYRNLEGRLRYRYSIDYKQHHWKMNFFYSNFAGLLKYVERNVPPSSTLLAYPEGLLINILTERTHPCRMTNFMPPEFDIFGEDVIVDDLDKCRPDFILVTTNKDRGPSVYGSAPYGLKAREWISEHYEIIGSFGKYYHLLESRDR